MSRPSKQPEDSIFAAALAQGDPQQRATFLAEACGADQSLRERIEDLLRHHAQAEGFLESPAVPLQGATGTSVDAGASAAAPASQSGLDRTEMSLDADSFYLGFLTPSDDAAALGRMGQYTVTEVIGRGGMGIVLKARDASLNRIVAIKMLAPELSGNSTARKRFLREARAAAAIVHQHVVTIHAVAEDRHPYLVMEYVDGQSLQEKIDAIGPLELKETLRIGTQVATGLAAAHAQGVVHRDIKPSNILLENGVERVRITDFGLARAADDVEITRTGEVAGSPQYMSPEQAHGQAIDARSDLFSFGCMLYAMCIGRPPFRAESMIAAIRRVCDDTPRPIREVNPDVPEWLTEIIGRLLAKRPDERYQTASEVADLLGQHLAQVQHPHADLRRAILPSNLGGERAGAKGWARKRWVGAALIICAILTGLGFTEATGVTHLAGTAVRIVTGEGTLIIELNDPTVQVALDGEVLTIRDGGVEQVRLRPGQYQFTATRDGRPVKRELVSITRGDRKVVTVAREPSAPTMVVTPATRTGAFALLGSTGDRVRNYDTLAEAVRGAGAGDTIEIRGNGPFATEPVVVDHPLRVRAGTGFRPVIVLDSERDKTDLVLLRANAQLTLEGLEFHRTIPNAKGQFQAIVQSREGLTVVNCRLMAAYYRDCLWSKRDLTLRNCLLLVSDPLHLNPFSWDLGSGGRAVIENCVLVGSALSTYKGGPFVAQMSSIRLQGNTLVAQDGIRLVVAPPPPVAGAEQPGAAADVRSSWNVFALRASMLLFDQAATTEPFEAAAAESVLRRFLSWREEQNVYDFKSSLCTFSLKNVPVGTRKDLVAWNLFWGLSKTRTSHGSVRFQGGDLFARAQREVEQLTPDDFRLHPDSVGYRARPDGKDLGADIDLVGPGAAYERWKKTPEYQEWLKETGQTK